MKTIDSYVKKLVSPIQAAKVELPKGCVFPSVDGHKGHGGGVSSIRHSTHKGRAIEIHTTYKILIDGKEIELHASVMKDGRVHTHSLPQYTFKSAGDMAKSLIDFFGNTEFFIKGAKKNAEDSHGAHH